MGRKSLKHYSNWRCIWVVNDPNAKDPICHPLDQYGKLINPFKARKHNRIDDHKAFLDSSSNASFSSHLLSPQPKENEEEGVFQNEISSMDFFSNVFPGDQNYQY